MLVSYKRELNHNYLIIESEKDIDVNRYEIKMMIENHLSCLLIMSIRYVNAKLTLYYEISSKQSMLRIYENRELGYEALKNLLFQFHKVLLMMEEYLINSNHLIIDPEYIYMNIETNEISFIYYPCHEEDAKEAFQKLAEYILNRINHQDEKAVFLAYKMYKDTRNKNFTLEEILDFSEIEDIEILEKDRYTNNEFKQVQKEESRSVFESISVSSETIFSEESSIKNEEKEDVSNKKAGTKFRINNENEIVNHVKSNNNKKFYVIAIVFLFILVGLLYLKYSGLLPDSISYDQFLIMLGTTVMIITGSIFKIYLDIKRYKINQEEKESIEWQKAEQDKVESGEELFWNEDAKQKIKAETTDTIQIYDFLSSKSSNTNVKDSFHEIFTDTVAEEPGIYGDTVLLGGVYDDSEKQILQGMIKGKEVTYQIDHLPFTVGKLAECVDLELKDDSISRMHARFFEREGKVYLEDLNSTNGTFKNGMRLEANETVKVEVEDEISFAKLTFFYH